MARRIRSDPTGGWHHVMNRGIARRPVFENRTDVRYFLACLARAVRNGWIEVHAYCVMTTHFHLLVCSPEGHLSLAMQMITNRYVRWFNRTRRRDGPLFRGRFTSYAIEDDDYRRNVFLYIESNPITARVSLAPGEYPFASSASLCGAFRRPPWLSLSWIESELRMHGSCNGFKQTVRNWIFGERRESSRSRVNAVLGGFKPAPDILDDLVNGNHPKVLEWMRRKAALADGVRAGLAVCTGAEVDLAMERHCRSSGHIDPLPIQQCTQCLQLRVALLRDLCGMSFTVIAQRIARHRVTASATYQAHVRDLATREPYGHLVAQLACAIPTRAGDGSRPLPRATAEDLRSEDSLALVPW